MNTSLEMPEPDSSELQRDALPALAVPAQPIVAPAPHTALGTALAALKPVMQQAFVLTTQGVPATAIAKEVGVTRATLHNWKKYNPKFRAAVNAWHQDQVESTNLSMAAMLPDAVETVRNEIRRNPNLAFKLIEKAAGFAPPPAGSISPRQMRKQIKLELRREKLRMRKRLEKIHIQEVNQRAQELEDKLEADRVEKLRKMDPAEVNRIRDYNARIERLAAELREARKHNPDYKLDENYVRAVLNPEAFAKTVTAEKTQQPPQQQHPQQHPQHEADVDDDSDDEEEEEEEEEEEDFDDGDDDDEDEDFEDD